MNELALFAGAGGGILGGKLLGWKTVAAVEFNSFCCRRLMQRQNEGHLPPFPIWDDVRTFDGTPWRGIVDVVSGGFPCQDISAAGAGAGLDGERSGLWSEMARIIREVRPSHVFVENSPMLTSRGLGRVLGDLAEMGFDAEWGVVSAADTGAPHLRERIWIVANARGGRCLQSKIRQMEQSRGAEAIGPGDELADTAGTRFTAGRIRGGHEASGEVFDLQPVHGSQALADSGGKYEQRKLPGVPDAQDWREQGERPAGPRSHGLRRWPVEPELDRVANGLANRVDRLRAIGNGQVSRVAAAAWEMLT